MKDFKPITLLLKQFNFKQFFCGTIIQLFRKYVAKHTAGRIIIQHHPIFKQR